MRHVHEAQRKLNTSIPWLCDTMENELKHTLGDAPTSEFVIDPQGKIVRRRAWGKIAELREDLAALVGEVENPTQPVALDTRSIHPEEVAPHGVVERIKKPAGMKPLYAEPEMGLLDQQPFYVKLRPQADRRLLQTGRGQLYLEFRPDILYGVHWNNLVDPIEIAFETGPSTGVSPRTLSGPKVTEPSDIDPREFLIDVENWEFAEPLRLTVKYFACNDEEGWCKPVTQHYTVFRAEDAEDGYFTSGMAHLGIWPQFRGARCDGKSEAADVPIRWGATENVKWKVPLPGPGDSSPIVSGDRVFITCATDEGRQRTLFCYARATGKQLWARTVSHPEVTLTHKTNPYCASTPLAVGQRVVVWHGSAGVHCYDFAGEKLWSRDLGKFHHIWGYGSSPIYFRDRVIINCGPGEHSFVIALRLSDGETIWQTDESGGDSGEPEPGSDSRGKYVGSWTTPVIARVDGEDQIVCSMPTRVNAYDIDSGRLIWFCSGLGNQPRGDVAYASPVVAGGMGLATGGYNGPAIGFRLGGEGDVTEENRLWRNTGPNPQRIGTGVMVGEYVYLANAGAGTIECVKTETGEQLWQSRIRGGNAWGSVVMAENRLYVTDQSGSTVVFAPNPEKYEEIAVNPLNESSNSTPAIANGEIFIRTFEHLYCIGG